MTNSPSSSGRMMSGTNHIGLIVLMENDKALKRLGDSIRTIGQNPLNKVSVHQLEAADWFGVIAIRITLRSELTDKALKVARVKFRDGLRSELLRLKIPALLPQWKAFYNELEWADWEPTWLKKPRF